MSEKKDWTHMAIKRDTLHRISSLKKPKQNRKKGEHYLETLETVLSRILDFYEEHSPSATR